MAMRGGGRFRVGVEMMDPDGGTRTLAFSVSEDHFRVTVSRDGSVEMHATNTSGLHVRMSDPALKPEGLDITLPVRMLGLGLVPLGPVPTKDSRRRAKRARKAVR